MSEVARPWCRCDVWAWGVSGKKKKHCQPQELQHVSGFPSSLGNWSSIQALSAALSRWDQNRAWATRTLSEALLLTRPFISAIMLWEGKEAWDKEQWGDKKPFHSSFTLLGKARNSRIFLKGLFKLALGVLLWSAQRQHKGYNRDQIQNPDSQSLTGKK